ncbi:hypothetical protein [uncultured Sphingomonas sp.]|uniref:hypothetical protein n=1 Tax=uncultured Sphingomonas sp. TaxID=158754 RepID=UPI0025EC11BF|nr:hypothetical protein [uncultured Sphingomonas sp.]
MDFTIAILIVAVLCLSVTAGLYALMSHRRREARALADYGRRRGPTRSWACPQCFSRTYSEKFIRERYCARCNKHFPDRQG